MVASRRRPPPPHYTAAPTMTMTTATLRKAPAGTSSNGLTTTKPLDQVRNTAAHCATHAEAPANNHRPILSAAALLITGFVLFLSSDVTSPRYNGAAGVKRSKIPSSAIHSTIQKYLTPIQTQVVHRHGDRTPITPLEDQSFWSGLLPTEDELDRLGQRTEVIRSAGAGTHPAGGGDVFGRLTKDGVERMIRVGKTLRKDVERLLLSSAINNGSDPTVWLRVASTDFSRTVQSVQAVLKGLLDISPKLRGMDKAEAISPVPIDARHTNKMIPDPQPRRFEGQAELESELMTSDAFRLREEKMKALAVRATSALFKSKILGDAALQVSFGVGEDQAATAATRVESPRDLGDGLRDSSATAASTTTKPLPWNQLAEILKCLEQTKRLPRGLSEQDVQAVAEHNAWRWFALLGDEKLAAMAIKSLAKKMVLNVQEAINGDSDNDNASIQPSPLFHLFSGHDATLIALLCAFRIERPSVWPEYGSFLKMELLRDDVGLCNASSSTLPFDGCNPGDNESNYYVAFSLNGEQLRSSLGILGGSHSRYFIPWEGVKRGLELMERQLPPLVRES